MREVSDSNLPLESDKCVNNLEDKFDINNQDSAESAEELEASDTENLIGCCFGNRDLTIFLSKLKFNNIL